MLAGQQPIDHATGQQLQMPDLVHHVRIDQIGERLTRR